MKQTTRRRILMLIENGPYSWDGRVRREATSLAAAGYEVSVICRKAPGESWRMQHGPVAAFQYPAPPSYNGFIGYVVEYSYALAATTLLSLWVAVTRGFDVIHAHNPPDLFVLIGMGYRIVGKRFVFDHHDLAPEMYNTRFTGRGNKWVHRALLFFERLSFRQADQVISANDSYKNVAIERGGIAASRIEVVRNGPEPCHLAMVAPEDSLIGDPRTLIGFVGDMSKHDGIDYLLRALSYLKLALKRDDWRCVLVGDGSAVSALKAEANALGLTEHLHFTGWLDYQRVPRYIRAMDICVAPDPSNGYSDFSTVVKLMEYMAQAKPMVVFDLIEHHITAGTSALYAQANNEQDFARQILRLMDDPTLRSELGAIGRARVLDSLAWNHQERRLVSAYERLFAERCSARAGIVEQHAVINSSAAQGSP